MDDDYGSVLGSESEALAAATAYQEAGASAVESWLATNPTITPDMLGQWVPGTTIPIYTLTEAKDINLPPSETGLRMGAEGLESFVNVLPEIPVPNITIPQETYVPSGGGQIVLPTPQMIDTSFVPAPLPTLLTGGEDMPIKVGTSLTQYNASMVPGGGTGYVATEQEQAAWGLIGTAVMGFLGSGLIKKAIALLLSLWGKGWFRVILGLLGSGVISAAVAGLLNDGRKQGKKHRRYSIGANPRLGTLIKVDKHCNKILRKFTNQARHAGVLRVPHRTMYYQGRGRKDLTVVR